MKNEKILIKNIYYMLTYAFKNLKSVCEYDKDCESFDNIQDLFSIILYKGISNQVKKGLYKEYIEDQEALSTIRGKININETIKTNSLIKKKLVCDFDEFSPNIYFNKILKSTCLLLLFKGDIKEENRKLLKKLLINLNEIDEIDLNRISWNSISYHRNNATYEMLIKICYLVVKGLLIATNDGNMKLQKFLDDQRMHSLYEKFILEYYKKHYPNLHPNANFIDWNICKGNNVNVEYLPKMKTDVTLTNGNKTIIIDAKFYSTTMQYRYDKERYISTNLYQIYTYVKNKDINNSGLISGILLYAQTTDEMEEAVFNMDGNYISIQKLDLNQNFEFIKEKLDSIVKTLEF